MTGRRFEDSGLHALDAMDPITDSDWSKLSDNERTELLRKRDAVWLARHQQIIAGQASIRDRVGAQGAAIKIGADATRKISKRLDDDIGPLLEENTAATARTEAKVDDLIKATATLVGFWTDASGAAGLIGRLSEAGKRFAWVAIPSASAYGAWLAIKAWVKTL